MFHGRLVKHFYRNPVLCCWELPCLSDFSLLVAYNDEKTAFTKRVTHQILAGKLLEAWPWILVTPQLRADAPLEIVFPKAKRDNVTNLLARHRLRVTVETAVAEAQWERCLRYSLCRRLAPSWNLIGTALVHGRKFLSQANYQFFVSIRIQVSKRLMINIRDSGMLRTRPVCLEQLFPHIRGDKNARQMLVDRLNDGEITLAKPLRCFVVPSMRPAMITSVTGRPVGVFDTVKKIAEYWRFVYGFDIESSLGTSAFFCNVQFFSTATYTYPNICLRLDQGSVVRRHNTDHIVEELRRDVGELLQITGAKPIQCIGVNWLTAKLTSCTEREWDTPQSEISKIQVSGGSQICEKQYQFLGTISSHKESKTSAVQKVIEFTPKNKSQPSYAVHVQALNGSNADQERLEDAENALTSDSPKTRPTARTVYSTMPGLIQRFENMPSRSEADPRNDSDDKIAFANECTSEGRAKRSPAAKLIEKMAVDEKAKRVIRFGTKVSGTRFVRLDNRKEFLKPQGIPLGATRRVRLG